ncbi:hypothetical protein [Polymorphobacter sp.]|uniref:hypothetical protein n=1 Tax=Polymorphobacter sp. TaxID=1909290 RepID=UPI003F71AA03
MEMLRGWFDGIMALGAGYGVNPLVFAGIYIGAIPFFLLFSGLAVKRRREGRAATGPVLLASLCFVSSYLYLAIVGRGIPLWVWGFLGLMLVYGAWSAVKGYRAKLRG